MPMHINPLTQTALLCACLVVAAQTARQVRGPAAVEAVDNEPPARIVVDPPLPGPLTHGRVVIQYRVENLHVIPVFGPAALAISPRVGHVHVSVDGASWVWADASGEPILLNGFSPGPHTVSLELNSANHQALARASVTFTVPATPPAAAPVTIDAVPHAKLIVDPPLPEPLARGVVFLPYRAENVRILPVFGEGALGVAPRIGHIHVTVDDHPWHWADSSGVPVIISGLSPGRHKVLIELVNADHQRLAQEMVQITLPGPRRPQ